MVCLFEVLSRYSAGLSYLHVVGVLAVFLAVLEHIERSENNIVKFQAAVHGVVPGVKATMGQACTLERCPSIHRLFHSDHCCVDVTARVLETVLSGGERVLGASGVGTVRGDRNASRAHGLQVHDRVGLTARRGEEDVGRSIRLVQALPGERVHGLDTISVAGVDDCLHERLQERAPADESELHLVAVLVAELDDDRDVVHDVLFFDEAAHVHDEVRIRVAVGQFVAHVFVAVGNVEFLVGAGGPEHGRDAVGRPNVKPAPGNNAMNARVHQDFGGGDVEAGERDHRAVVEEEHVLAEGRAGLRHGKSVLHCVSVVRDHGRDAKQPAKERDHNVHGGTGFQDVDHVRTEAQKDAGQEPRVRDAERGLRAHGGEDARDASARGASNLVLILGLERRGSGDDVDGVVVLHQALGDVRVERGNAVNTGVRAVRAQHDAGLLSGGQSVALHEDEAEESEHGEKRHPNKECETRRIRGPAKFQRRVVRLLQVSESFLEAATVGVLVHEEEGDVHGDDVAAENVEGERRGKGCEGNGEVDGHCHRGLLTDAVADQNSDEGVQKAQEQRHHCARDDGVDDLNVVELFHLRKNMRGLRRLGGRTRCTRLWDAHAELWDRGLRHCACCRGSSFAWS